MNKEEYQSRVDELISIFNPTEDDLLEKIQSIRDNYKEELHDDLDKDGISWHEKYTDLQKRYRDKFFSSGSEVHFEDNTHEEEVKVKTIKDLFN